MDTIRVEQTQDVLVRTAAVIAEQRQFAQRLRQRTVADPLTGLPVRSLLVDRLELALSGAGNETGRLAVLSVDLDGIATLETAHGHRVADRARSEAAGRLVSAVRQGDVVARTGPQTFVLLCPGIHVPEDAHRIGRRVGELLDRPLHPAPHLTHRVRVSVGVALSGRASTADSLLAGAAEAMDRVRGERQGTGRHG